MPVTYPLIQAGVQVGGGQSVCSLGGDGNHTLGGKLHSLTSAGASQNYLDDGSGNMICTGNLTVHGTTEFGESLIAEEAVVSNVITFASIPQTPFNHLRLVFIGASTESASETDTLTIEINTDTSAHYDFGVNELYNNSGSAGVKGVVTAAASIGTLGFIPAASATANIPGVYIVDIPLYAGTVWQKTALWRGGYQDIATASTDYDLKSGILTLRQATPAGVSAIVLAAGTGHLLTGSVAYLYGIV